jgi:hypothetical protein
VSPETKDGLLTPKHQIDDVALISSTILQNLTDKHSFLLKNIHSHGFSDTSEEWKIIWQNFFFFTCLFLFFLSPLLFNYSKHQPYLLPFLFTIPPIVPMSPPLSLCLQFSVSN